MPVVLQRILVVVVIELLSRRRKCVRSVATDVGELGAISRVPSQT